MKIRKLTAMYNALLMASSSLVLSACLLNDEIEDGPVTAVPQESVQIDGSLGAVPVVGATVSVTDANGATVASTESDDQANFSVTIPENASYPLALVANGGTNMVTGNAPRFQYRATASSALQNVVNLSPLTTLAVSTASCMGGGVSAANIELATNIMAVELAMGLDTVRHNIGGYTPINSNNIAPLMLSNNTLSETVRRANAALAASASPTGADDILRQIGCDLSDGLLDGVGDGVDRRVILSFIAASTGAMLDSMAHEPRTDGSAASGRMDQAITLVLRGLSNPPSVTSVAINSAF
ncbi:MAG: hypothetical protein ACR2PS_01660, partial [Pseudomonadales bacterium]